MSKNLKLLIVEDDKKFGESLLRILGEEGFDCMLADKPQAALSLCKLHTFDVALIDCMLPQMNGIDLALKIKESGDESMLLFLMSGIYKDKNFSVTALKKTGAEAFLIKPFNIADFIQQIADSTKEKTSEISLVTKSIKGLILQENLSQSLIYSIIGYNPIINGHELSLVLSALLNYKCQGLLKIQTDKISFDLNFNEDKVSMAPLKINSTSLKELLLSRDYVPAEDLENLNVNELHLSRLQELNLISPHFCKAIEKEFLINSLMELAKNENINLKFQQTTAEVQKISFDQKEIESLIYQWVVQTDIHWLKAFYLPQMSSDLKKMSLTQNRTQNFPLVAGHKAAVTVMLKNLTISDYLADCQLDEEKAYQLLHLMIVFREFHIGAKQTNLNFKAQLARLKNLQTGLENQNAFERLGLTDRASENDLKKSYLELSQSLHPDKLIGAPDEIRTLSLLVYEKIQEAYNQIKTPEKREIYLQRLETLKAAQAQKAELMLEKVVISLSRGDITEAEKLCGEVAKMVPYSPYLKLIQCWISLKTKKEPLAQITKNLQSLPAAEKEKIIFTYVKGLTHLASQELDKAQVCFKNVLSKEPNFMPARRDLMSMSPKDDKKPVNILNADIKDVVGLFFNKKKAK